LWNRRARGRGMELEFSAALRRTKRVVLSSSSARDRTRRFHHGRVVVRRHKRHRGGCVGLVRFRNRSTRIATPTNNTTRTNPSRTRLLKVFFLQIQSHCQTCCMCAKIAYAASENGVWIGSFSTMFTVQTRVTSWRT
jgi:hypothetical protein